MFTDRFGSPLAVGDKIVVALSAGRGSAELKETVLTKIVALVPHRDKTEPKMEQIYDNQRGWVPTGKIEGFYYMRADQGSKPTPTSFYRRTSVPPDKLFVLQYQNYATYDHYSGGVKKGDPTKRQSFDRVMDVIRVPDGA